MGKLDALVLGALAEKAFTPKRVKGMLEKSKACHAESSLKWVFQTPSVFGHDNGLQLDAAGAIGKVLRGAYRGKFRLRLSDVAPLGEAGPGEELVNADISDLAACGRMVQGVECVVHLGAVPVEDAWEKSCRRTSPAATTCSRRRGARA